MVNNPYPQQQSGQLVLAIKEQEINVAPESKAEIHVGVINQTGAEDYVNLLVKGIPSEWVTIDTPVVRLAPGEAKQVIITIQPPPLEQSRVGRYPFDVQAVSQNNPKISAVARSFLTVAGYQSGGRIEVLLTSIYFSVVPGSSITIPLLLQNHGLREDVFQLNIEGIPANWVSTNGVFTKLEPGQSKEIEFTIRVPRSPDAGVGRTPFRIIFISQDFPDQRTEVECILTIAAFSKFSAYLQPKSLNAEQFGQIVINNEGNTVDTYSLNFLSPANLLIFEKEIPVARKSSSGSQQTERAYVEIPPSERIQIDAGMQGIYPFRSRLRSRPLFGEEKAYPFTAKVVSTQNMAAELPAETSDKGYIPPWAAAIALLGTAVLCLLLLIPLNNIQAAARATQTAFVFQTQAALNETQIALEATEGTPTQTILPTFVTETPTPTSTFTPTFTPIPTSTLSPTPIVVVPPTNIVITATPVVLPTITAFVPPTSIVITATPIVIPTIPIVLPPTSTSAPLISPTPVFPPLQGVMLFESNRDGNSQIYAMNLANQSLSRLTNNTATNIQPALAPDGVRFVYVSNQNGNNEIYLSGLDRRPAVNLTNNAGDDQQPTWSPDGNWIAFTSNRDGNQEIYVMRSDGSQAHNLTNNPASDFAPTWFSVPNFLGLGTEDWIAFTTNRDGNQEIYRVRPDGSGLTNLTKNPANDYSPSGFAGGNTLAFVSDRDGNAEIYTMTADGGNQTNVTNNFAQDFDPTIGAKGQWILFSSDRDGNMDIYAVNLADGKTYDLTRNPSQDGHPDWLH